MEVPFINFQPLQTNNTIMQEKDTANPEWVNPVRYHVLDTALDDLESYKKLAKTAVRCDTIHIKQYFRCNVKEPEVKCYMNYLRIVIKPNGKLWTCLKYHRDIYNNSLRDLWYSEGMRQDRIDSKKCKSLCLQRCIYLANAESLSQICEALLSDLQNMDKSHQADIITQAIEFFKEQRKVISDLREKQQLKEEELNDIEESLKEIAHSITILASYS